MPIAFCPHCNQRYSYGFDTTDYVHQCNSGNPAVDQDDVVVIGDWEDFSGSGTTHPQGIMRQGMSNELQGTRAGIEGMDEDEVTPRGNVAATHRQRQHLEFINLKKGGLD